MPIGVGVGRNSATSAAIRNHKSAAPALFSVNLQCNLPTKAERSFEQVLAEKKGRVAGGGNQWQDRLCILTDKKLVLSKPGSDEALDVIPLREVVDVSHVSNVRRSEGDVYRQAQDAMDHENAFFVDTDEDGLCAGRNYCFRTDGDESCQEWISRLRQATQRERRLAEVEMDGTGLKYWRTRARKIYKSRPAQTFFCVVIVAAFLVSVVSSEVQPEEGSRVYDTFAMLQTSFTLAFTVELLFNMFGSLDDRFFRDYWNVFDAVVVVVSILAETLEGFPAFSMIRLVRVFRVVRVFRWMTSLRQILFALMSAILPVINSFLILLLVTCIYAVLATELFKNDSEEYFGTFSASLLTMFQIATGDAWASIVGRSLRNEDGSLHVFAILFLVSYVLLVGLVLINIVIAVLLDEFLSTVAHEKESCRQEEQGRMRKQMGMVESPLEPLLESISSFFSNEDLSARIQHIFKLLDTNANQSLSCEELNHGLRKLDFHPPIHLSADDFEVLTEGKRLCTEDGELDHTAFEVMMRTQLQQHVQMKAATALVSADSVSKSLLFVLKQMALTLELISPVSAQTEAASRTASSAPLNADAKAAICGPDMDAEEGTDLEPPCSFYVGQALRSHVKLPSGMGYGRWRSNPHHGSFAKTWKAPRRWKGYGSFNAGRSWSPVRTSREHSPQHSPHDSPIRAAVPKRSIIGRSLSFNLDKMTKFAETSHALSASFNLSNAAAGDPKPTVVKPRPASAEPQAEHEHRLTQHKQGNLLGRETAATEELKVTAPTSTPTRKYAGGLPDRGRGSPCQPGNFFAPEGCTFVPEFVPQQIDAPQVATKSSSDSRSTDNADAASGLAAREPAAAFIEAELPQAEAQLMATASRVGDSPPAKTITDTECAPGGHAAQVEAPITQRDIPLRTLDTRRGSDDGHEAHARRAVHIHTSRNGSAQAPPAPFGGDETQPRRRSRIRRGDVSDGAASAEADLVFRSASGSVHSIDSDRGADDLHVGFA